MAALKPSVRTLMKNTVLSASLDTVVSLAFRELLKRKKRASPSTIFPERRFPNQTWTSIAVLYNPSMPLIETC